MAKKYNVPVIICGGATGRAVIYGYTDELPQAETIVKVHNARMVLYWSAECGGLLGLAASGPKTTTRITCAVPSVSDTARQVIAVSSDAAAAFDKWPPV